MEHDARYTVAFTALLCVVCSALVSAVAVGLRERQEENRQLDRMKNVLAVSGLVEPGERQERAEIQRRFAEGLEPRVVNLATGAFVEDVDPLAYDQRKAAADPDTSRPAPKNPARVRRLPEHAVIYLLRREGRVEGIILPVEGMGLWSTLYGFLALEADARTIRGLTFYEHGETAGLGGEVDNPRWKALWAGRLAFGDDWRPRITVEKGRAGTAEADPYGVDGLSGATLTSNGVTHLLHFWLGDHGFGPYLAAYRQGGGGQAPGSERRRDR
ncbi:MAG: Na(+)-translocating NADH-quinone reductase subunit C [Deltaproteobacteria bacterium]|nr:Na(+)-translocating NADH-quinone reductase subunit C [Deltaproteobacteria bacterium]MBW2447879.1 Na(+)-translocating NADH-quinone reductase subunit C [Deltaproteobacteria bacterium]